MTGAADNESEGHNWLTKSDTTSSSSPDTARVCAALVRSRSQGAGGAEEASERTDQSGEEHNVEMEFERSCVIPVAENSIEAQRINNNYRFGFKKWKSHVTSRPIDRRSEIVQDLYSDISKVKVVKVRTLTPSNMVYVVLIGWWVCLLYGLIGILMFISLVGIPYAKFCWKFARYFLWPFGQFVHQVKSYRTIYTRHSLSRSGSGGVKESSSFSGGGNDETSALLSLTPVSGGSLSGRTSNKCREFWFQPSSWAWAILGLPPLLLVHTMLFAVCWFFVVLIPTAKLNGKMLTKILYIPPTEIVIGDSEINMVNLDGSNSTQSEIVMYSHQSINVYYYKYTVHGVNVIIANSLVFVVLSIFIGFFSDIDDIAKCVLGIVSIIPLTYYIGMAITSISAQSSFAVGALLNATFGSAVEVIMNIIILKKGRDTGKECYQELVKSSLTGAILVSILFIPGISMTIGGLKYRTQRFNPRSASVSSALLFLACIGVFGPTVFSMMYGEFKCHKCHDIGDNPGAVLNATIDIICARCEDSLTELVRLVYHDHIKPLVYGICIVLPAAYVIGIVFTMKTHSRMVFDDFEKELRAENNSGLHGHGTAHWSCLKSIVILFISAVLIALCGEIISSSIDSFMEDTGISEYFVGVTMLSLVSELPEVVNGIQFALQNNVNLGIEIGCSTAVQVCLVQIPILVLVNLIYDMDFILIFNHIHMVAIFFSVLVINYIFQDGKSDYFQGYTILSIFILLMLMYYFMLTPDSAKCDSPPDTTAMTTTTTMNPFWL